MVVAISSRKNQLNSDSKELIARLPDVWMSKITSNHHQELRRSRQTVLAISSRRNPPQYKSKKFIPRIPKISFHKVVLSLREAVVTILSSIVSPHCASPHHTSYSKLVIRNF